MFSGNKSRWTSLALSIAFMLFGLSIADAKSTASSSKKKNSKNTSESKSSKKVKIDADDPKAFTKALLLEKDGVEYEIVNLKALAQKNAIEKEAKDYFDFSMMLIPITHEALIGSPYGIRDHRLHRGVDVAVIKDEPVVAALPGVVVTSAYNKGGYGHYVIIEHENGIQTLSSDRNFENPLFDFFTSISYNCFFKLMKHTIIYALFPKCPYLLYFDYL